MSPRAARLLLFAVLALALPLPFWLVETGAEPAVRLAMFEGVLLAVIATEGARGAVGIAAALLGVQVLVYLVALWLASGLVLWPLRARSRGARAAVAGGVAAVLLVAAATSEIYRTPFRTRSLRGDLFAIFE
jgi:hypothetical protein